MAFKLSLSKFLYIRSITYIHLGRIAVWPLKISSLKSAELIDARTNNLIYLANSNVNLLTNLVL
jgi:hypothetical protein